MIYSNKIEKNVLMIKMIENNNINSFSIKLNIDISIIHIFRELYLNIHKNNNYSNITSYKRLKTTTKQHIRSYRSFRSNRNSFDHIKMSNDDITSIESENNRKFGKML